MTKRTFTLDQVLEKVRAAGYRVTPAEEALVRRRLAKGGTLNPDGVGPDPLAGADDDPVAAVQRVLDERVGLGAETFSPRPDVAALLGGDTGDDGPEQEPPRTADQPVPRDADPEAEKPVEPDAPQPPTSTPASKR